MITKYNTYIKENNQFLINKQSIKDWLNSMNITWFTINDDLTVYAKDCIDISNKNLTKLPVKFDKVDGYFDCSDNKLTTLEGCPSYVRLHFACSDNKLTTLKGCPKIIGDGFYCCNNTDLVDINDLDSKILIQSIKNIRIKEKVYDKYFEYWIDKDINILGVLKDKISDKIKNKYSHIFNAKKFDLL